MHIMGLLGMPRRVYTYPANLEWGSYNLVASIGAFVLAAGFGLFVINIFYSLRRGAKAGRNPWGSDSLEWHVPSPPPLALFGRIPVVHSRHPLWDGSDLEPREPQTDDERISAAMEHRPYDWRATLLVDVLTGQPRGIVRMAGPSYMPLVVAIGIVVLTIATIAKAYWALPIGGLISIVGLVVWLWPDKRELEKMYHSTLPEETGLPIVMVGTKSLGWLGMVFLLMVLSWLLLTLFYTYFYLRLYSDQWPQGGLPIPDLFWPSIGYGALLLAGGLAVFSWRAFRRDSRWSFRLSQAAICGLAMLFYVMHTLEFLGLSFGPQTNAYGSAFCVISWVVDLVVFVGFMLAATAFIRSWLVKSDWPFFLGPHAQLAALFWCYIGVIGPLVYAVLYLSPRLL